MATLNWRTINVDALDPDSPANFDLSTLTPAVTPVSTADVQSLAGQIRQLLRGGDSQGALQGALENVPYGADDKGKVRRCNSYLVPPETCGAVGMVAVECYCTCLALFGHVMAMTPSFWAPGFQRPGRSAPSLAQGHN